MVKVETIRRHVMKHMAAGLHQSVELLRRVQLRAQSSNGTSAAHPVVLNPANSPAARHGECDQQYCFTPPESHARPLDLLERPSREEVGTNEEKHDQSARHPVGLILDPLA